MNVNAVAILINLPHASNANQTRLHSQAIGNEYEDLGLILSMTN